MNRSNSFAITQNLQRTPQPIPLEVRAADQMVQALSDHGVDRVFGIPGGTISPLFDALAASDIDVVLCQQETMAVYMAYGHARATGRPGVVLVTSGPGVLNAVHGVAAGLQDEVPLLILAGEITSANFGRGALQDGGPSGLDVCALMRPITKYLDTLQQPERTGLIIQQALNAAMEHPRGPAFVRLPLDRSQRSLPTMNYVQAVPTGGAVDERSCLEVVELLVRAERPAIFVGIGARLAGIEQELLLLAERGRIPVITDVEAKGLFPESHPLSLGLFGLGSFGRAENYLQEGCDLLVFLGARLDDTTTNGYSELLGTAQITVQLDYDPRRLCRSYQADVAVCCDLRATLQRIVDQYPAPDPRLLLTRDAALRRTPLIEFPRVLDMGEQAPFDPNAVVAALQASFGPNTVYTSDIGNHLLFAARGLRIEQPGCFHVSNGLGGMGSGIGTAMGLASAYKGTRRVVSICGDGGLLMVGNELATCAHHDIPVVLAVFNNGGLGMVDHGFERVFGRRHDVSLPKTDLVAYAKSLGVTAWQVQSKADLERAAALAGRGPILLDIPIDAEVRALNPRDATLNFSAGSR